MEPVRIELKNFTCYQHEVFDFTSVSTAALCGPNGSGKSSLIDGMLWALFGQTPRTGARNLDNIVRQGTDLAEVIFDFRLGEQTYRVHRIRDAKRHRSGIELFAVDGESLEPLNGASATETQKALEKLLRMDYKAFIATSIIAQGKSDLLTSDMTDAERKEILARILGLDLWEEAHERVKEKILETKTELASTEAQINSVKELAGKDEEIDRAIKNTESELHKTTLILNSLRQIAKDREQLGKLKEELSRIELVIHDAQAQIDKANEIIAKKDEIQKAHARSCAIEAQVGKLSNIERTWAHLQSELDELRNKAFRWDANHDRELQRLLADIEHAQKQASLLDEVPCKGTNYALECKLLMQARNASASLEDLTARLNALQSEKNPHKDSIKAVEEQIKSLDYNPSKRALLDEERARIQGLASLMPLLQEAEKSVSDHLSRLQDSVRQQVRLRVELTKLEATIKDESDYGMSPEEAEALVNRAREELGSLRSQKKLAEEAKAKLDDLVQRQEALTNRLHVLAVLERACNKNTGVPTLIIESAVPQIEAYANDLVGQLTHGRFQVRLETQVQTKSGTVQEALRIMVLDQGQERPYETYSGGEKFLIDLSIRIALSRFLAHRAGASVNLLVIDEGIASMDISRRHLIIEAINALKDKFNKVLVISHLPELEDAFPQRISAVPGPSGTKLQLVA